MRFNTGTIVRVVFVLTIGALVFLGVNNIERVRNLSEENRHLNQQNLTYMRCLATVFATYTQNQIPVTIKDLNTCEVIQKDGKVTQVTALPTSDGFGSTSVTSPIAPHKSSSTSSSASSESSTKPSSSPKPTPSPKPPLSNNVQPVKILGIPLCAPLTSICIKN